MNKKIQKALNDQVNHELFSAYQYLGMAAFFDEKGFVGFAKWMKLQYEEELQHVMKLYDYIFARNGMVELEAVAKPKGKWDGPKEVFEAALDREKGVTDRINDLVDMAAKEKDHATHNFLQWFVSEQVEEEALFQEVIQRFELIGDDRSGLIILDRELGGRTAEPAD